MDKLSEKIQNQQMLILALVAIGAIAALALITWLIVDGEPAKQYKKEKIKLATPLDHIDEQNYLLERTQNAIANSESKTETLSNDLDKVRALNHIQSAQLSAYESQLHQLTEHLDDMRQQMQMLENQVTARAQNTRAYGDEPPFLPQSGDMLSPSTHTSGSILSYEFELAPIDADIANFKNVDNYVPAGSYVRAVMLGGMDAPAGVMGQNNPKPILFRIVEDGTLPNHQKSHLKDCVVTGAGVGDISSERGYIRLERLSCTKPGGEIIDIPVQGGVFGPAGKSGVRGKPVWREGALLQRAALAGLFSGLSEGIAEQYTKTTNTYLGQTKTIDNKALFEFGAAQGAANAMEKLADYNIKRAEQYQPIIQISPGVEVDLVFLKGFYLTEMSDENKNIPKQTKKKAGFDFNSLPEDNFLRRES